MSKWKRNLQIVTIVKNIQNKEKLKYSTGNNN